MENYVPCEIRTTARLKQGSVDAYEGTITIQMSSLRVSGIIRYEIDHADSPGGRESIVRIWKGDHLVMTVTNRNRRTLPRVQTCQFALLLEQMTEALKTYQAGSQMGSGTAVNEDLPLIKGELLNAILQLLDQPMAL